NKTGGLFQKNALSLQVASSFRSGEASALPFHGSSPPVRISGSLLPVDSPMIRTISVWILRRADDVAAANSVVFSLLRVYIQIGRRGGGEAGRNWQRDVLYISRIYPRFPAVSVAQGALRSQHDHWSLLYTAWSFISFSSSSSSTSLFPFMTGMMDARVGFSFLILLIICCIHCDSRSLGTSDGAVSETTPGVKTEYLQEYEKHKKFCILCEHFATQATQYLKENKTQGEIIEIFHRACHRLPSFQQQLRIVERLVKGCVMAERFAEQCQTLIFQYGPVLLVNIVRLLERADLCVSLHACQGNRNETVVPYTSSVALPLNDM
ncbi:hypothetical protein Taro_039067, partial [Colocasia esculenta]|nr:hypothetical protein [Colocasia esculenta]